MNICTKNYKKLKEYSYKLTGDGVKISRTTRHHFQQSHMYTNPECMQNFTFISSFFIVSNLSFKTNIDARLPQLYKINPYTSVPKT